ncbi:hypothetical protein L218DRAFT_1010299 [Marasmius fiardii PR-910]|nr:hypothetical protein L218DRAFT_1010299 [Marasmius fiardii PR-910]
MPPLFAWLTGNVRTTTAATLSVPLNVSLGSIGQLLGVYIYKGSESPGFPSGHYTNAAFALSGALSTLCLRMFYMRRNRRLREGERRWRL